MFNMTRHTRVPDIITSRRANGKDVPTADAQLRRGRCAPASAGEKTIAPQTRTPQTRAARLCPASPPDRQKPRFGPGAVRVRRSTSLRFLRPAANADGFALLRRAGQGARQTKRRAHPSFPRPGGKAPRLRANLPTSRRAWLPDRLPKGPRDSPPRAARAPLP